MDNRLRTSIHFIDLDVRDDPEAIRPAWGYRAYDGKKTYAHITEALAEARQRLLILGRPGSGKSTALVHLAKFLLRQAEKDADAPLPFVVNLSKFQLAGPVARHRIIDRKGDEDSDKRENRFEEWFAGEMADFPGLSRNLARKWIRQGRVAALLDGLDEFNDDHRAGLVRLLNLSFLRDYPGMTVVICSRINEYDVLRSDEETTLQLSSAVELQPLTDAQIDSYLKERNAKGLLAALPSDPALQELARTPLTLSMLVGAYGRSSPGNLSAAGGLGQRRHELFSLYVERMLQRQARKEKLGIPLDDSRVNDIPVSEYRYSPAQVQRWLGWLAVILSVVSKTSFSVTNVYKLLDKKPSTKSQSIYLCAVWVSYACLISIMLVAAGLTFIPLRMAEWEHVLAILAGVSIALLMIRTIGNKWEWVSIPAAVLGSAVFIYDAGLVATALAVKVPLGLSPGPMSVVLVAALFAVPLSVSIALTGFSPSASNERSWACCLGGLLLAAAFHEIPFSGHLGFLKNEWSQMAAAGGGVAIGLAFAEKRFKDRIVILLGAVAVGGVLAGTSALVGPVVPAKVMLAAASSFVAIFAMGEFPSNLVLQMALTVSLAIGGVLGGAPGAVIGGGVFAFFFAAIASASDARPDSPWLKSVIDRITAWVPNLFGKAVLNPVFWLVAALARRAPWLKLRFFNFSTDAFLLKQSGAEFEFVHRLLRDHFALSELLPALDTTDRTVRLAAIESLGYQGESALEVLADLSGNPDADVRAAALAGLGHISSPVMVKILERRMEDRAPQVRRAFLRGAVKLPYGDASPLIKGLQPLGDGSEVEVLFESAGTSVSQYLVESMLEDMGPSISALLIARLGDRRDAVRAMAAKVLGSLHDANALEPLLALYASEKKTQVRLSVVGALANLRESRGLSAVLTRLKERIPLSERLETIEVLGQWPGNEVIQTLQEYLADRDLRVRVAAAKSLKHQKSSASGLLVARLQDREPEMRVAAVESLALGDDPEMIKSLLPMMQDPSAEVRVAVLRRIRWFPGAEIPDSLKPLLLEPTLDRLNDPDLFVRTTAVEILPKLGDPRAIEALIRMLNDSDAEIRAAAAEGMRTEDPAYVQPLLRRLDDFHPKVRAAAAKSLGRCGGAEAVAPLLAKLEDQDPVVRAAAVDSLGKLGGAETVQPLIMRLADPEVGVRNAVAESVEQLHEKGAIQERLEEGPLFGVEPLVSAMEDGDDETSVRAAQTLARLGDPRGRAALNRFLDDPSRRKRRLAVSRLAKDLDWTDQRVLGGYDKWIDPQEMVTDQVVASRVEEISWLSEEDIRNVFRKMKDEFHLRLEF